MLAAYAILVPTLYRNHRTRLHGFQQHCMADWRFYFFKWCLTKSLTGCWVECQAAVSTALVSVNFHSKESIKLDIFFHVKDLIYTYVKRLTTCSSNIAWIAWVFSCAMFLGASETTMQGPRLHKLLTLNGTFFLSKVVWSISGNIA